jgi:acyl-CoA thioester hydrolase
MAAFTWSFRVRYHECDAQKIVFNANYFLYFDMTITELMRAAFPGEGYAGIVAAHGVDFVLAEASARFLGSARFDDVIELRAEITRLGTTGMSTEMAVVRDDEVLVDGTLRYVFLDATTWEKTPIPDAMRSTFEPWAQSAR